MRLAPSDGHPPDVAADRDFSVHLDIMIAVPASTRRRLDVAAADALEAIAYGSVAVTARAVASNGVELTFPQWRVLVIVGETAVGASVSEVATRLGAELSPTSRLVRRLVGRGLAVTAKSETDRRVTRVRLTESGHGLRDAVLRGRRAMLNEVLVDVGLFDDSAVAVLDRIGEGFARYR
jgi:DNA-binding MarR family transcriptional regulator